MGGLWVAGGGLASCTRVLLGLTPWPDPWPRHSVCVAGGVWPVVPESRLGLLASGGVLVLRQPLEEGRLPRVAVCAPHGLGSWALAAGPHYTPHMW